jgi:predicted nucleic acid-binding protein
MIFAAIPANAAVFVDANTFVYHFSRHAVLAGPCHDLLDRIYRQQLVGFTSSHVLSDVAHRLMTLEAATTLGWTGPNIAKRLRQQPAEIQKLSQFRQAIVDVPRFGVQVLPGTPALVETGAALSQGHGLLSGDALIVAVMQDRALATLASHDGDLDRVPGLTRFAPV